MIRLFILFIFLIIILIICIYKFNLSKNINIDVNEKVNKNIKEYYESSYNTYTAVIVEPRKHKALEFVLNNFLENLSKEWNIIIFHGNQNEDYVKDIITNKLSYHISRITLINLNVDNLTIPEYNNLLVSRKFYNYIPTEIFLIFQTDTIICNEYKSYINNYLKYDYVGAPWKHRNMKVGNGGLSLRRKSKMLEIIDNCPYKNKMNEDLYFTQECPEIHRNIPIWQDAIHFSIEDSYEDKSFGVHKPWVVLKDHLYKKNKHCFELDKLVELNK
jgi:hypothetical protein